MICMAKAFENSSVSVTLPVDGLSNMAVLRLRCSYFIVGCNTTEDGFHEMPAVLEVRDETKDTRGHAPVPNFVAL